MTKTLTIIGKPDFIDGITNTSSVIFKMLSMDKDSKLLKNKGVVKLIYNMEENKIIKCNKCNSVYHRKNDNLFSSLTNMMGFSNDKDGSNLSCKCETTERYEGEYEEINIVKLEVYDDGVMNIIIDEVDKFKMFGLVTLDISETGEVDETK